jgi:hypothetical protein
VSAGGSALERRRRLRERAWSPAWRIFLTVRGPAV